MKKILIVTLSVSIVLIGFSVVSVAEEGRERVGNWIVEKEEDPLTDKLLIGLGVFSNETNESDSSVTRILMIRLSEGTTELYISCNEYLDNDIAYRFDEGKMEKTEWDLGQSENSLFFPDTEDLESFVGRLIKSEKFIIGVYPQYGKRQTDVFELKGLGKALLPYLKDFAWEDLRDTIEKEIEAEE